MNSSQRKKVKHILNKADNIFPTWRNARTKSAIAFRNTIIQQLKDSNLTIEDIILVTSISYDKVFEAIHNKN